MRRLVMLAAAILLVGCATHDNGALRPNDGRIFREVTVGYGVKIKLGEPISSEVRQLLVSEGPNRFAMRPGTFRGAESLVLLLTADGLVDTLHFIYSQGTDYAATVQSYETTLGVALERMPSSGENQALTRWQDSSTVFEISREGANVRSKLSNRAL